MSLKNQQRRLLRDAVSLGTEDVLEKASQAIGQIGESCVAQLQDAKNEYVREIQARFVALDACWRARDDARYIRFSLWGFTFELRRKNKGEKE